MTVRFLLPLAVIAAAWCGALAADEPGTVLVYEVDKPEDTHSEVSMAEIDSLVAAIGSRLQAGHGKGALVRIRDGKSIEVIIRGNDPKTVQRVARLVESPGTLEFRVLANRRDHKGLIERAEKADAVMLRDEEGKPLAWWVPVNAKEEAALQKDKNIATRKRKQGDRQSTEVLVVKDAFDLGGRYLKSASVGVDSHGKPCVDFALNDQGGKRLRGLTGTHLPDSVTDFRRRLGIILDGRLHSAPNIMSTIADRGQISGNFTGQEVEHLVAVLQAGSLPLRIKRVKESTLNPKR